MPNDTLPEWEQVLSSAAHLQRLLPESVLVGGAAAALYAGHRLSIDADHVLTDLRLRFDQVLAELESVAGWKTARIRRPVQILGSLDGIETGVMGREKLVEALQPFDRLYPQPNEESALQQLQIQLANPLPYDLEELNLAEYKKLDARWRNWQTVKATCADCATLIFDHIVGLEE